MSTSYRLELPYYADAVNGAAALGHAVVTLAHFTFAAVAAAEARLRVWLAFQGVTPERAHAWLLAEHPSDGTRISAADVRVSEAARIAKTAVVASAHKRGVAAVEPVDVLLAVTDAEVLAAEIGWPEALGRLGVPVAELRGHAEMLAATASSRLAGT